LFFLLLRLTSHFSLLTSSSFFFFFYKSQKKKKKKRKKYRFIEPFAPMVNSNRVCNLRFLRSITIISLSFFFFFFFSIHSNFYLLFTCCLSKKYLFLILFKEKTNLAIGLVYLPSSLFNVKNKIREKNKNKKQNKKKNKNLKVQPFSFYFRVYNFQKFYLQTARSHKTTGQAHYLRSSRRDLPPVRFLSTRSSS
jgi:hypothetical protein